jgi:hypothetical protein
MKKFTSALIKIAVLSALSVPLAFAADAEAGSSFAEPLYLSLCGLILLTFGMLKGRNEKDS